MSVGGRSVNLSLLCLDAWQSVGVDDIQVSVVVRGRPCMSSRRARSSPRMSSIRNDFLATGTGSSCGRDAARDIIRVSPGCDVNLSTAVG